MLDLPTFIPVVFILTTAATIYCFYRASYSRVFLVITLAWLSIQAALAWSGFYINEKTVPPRFPLAIAPVLVFIVGLFFTSGGRRFLDQLDLCWLTLLHLVRFPVELVLHWLYGEGFVPKIATFEGWNLDILSGLTAPIIVWLAFSGNTLRRPKLLLGWNIATLILLIIIVGIAFQSIPTNFQRLALEEPMTAILYFPYIWLPAGIVPLVLLGHLAVLRRLMKG